MNDFVAYYRVSTDGQGVSGLGLEAQRQAVSRHVTGRLLQEFTEVETGKRANRPQLLAALDLCKRRKATLVIAKLDRLARNVHFISGLMESGVEFVAADMPQANRLTIHVMAAFAEHEAEMISVRTKAALQAAKARGTVLGNPRWRESIGRARQAQDPATLAEARQAKDPVKPAPEVIDLMREQRSQGLTLRAIADRLNRVGLRTPKGNQWYASTVANALTTCNT